jgi:hypothetical protein
LLNCRLRAQMLPKFEFLAFQNADLPVDQWEL